MFKIAVAASAALLAALVAQTWRLNMAKSDVLLTQVELNACGARLDNLIEDLESDNAIDNLPDDALISVPDRWLRVPDGG